MKDVLLITLTIIAALLLIYTFTRRKKKAGVEEQRRKTKARQQQWRENRRMELANDKERVTEAEIRSLLIDLRMPKTIVDLYDGVCADEVIRRELHNGYAAPYAILDLTKRQQDEYLIDRYKPILAYNHATIFAYDEKLKGFITYNIETGLTEKNTCLTWDGLFVAEILRWWEYEIADADIRHIGKQFGLKHTDEILDSIRSVSGSKGFAAVDEWNTAMCRKLNAVIE